MFWGLKLEAEKQYSQLVEKPFHISHAALGPLTHDRSTGPPVFPQHIVEVHAIVEKTDYIICYLDASKRLLQQSLDLNISEGEEIVLYCKSGLQKGFPCSVYLTGYFIEEVGYSQSLEDLTNDEYSVSDFTEEDEERERRHRELASLLYRDLSSGESSDEEYMSESVTETTDEEEESLLALPPVIEEVTEEKGNAKTSESSRRNGKRKMSQTREAEVMDSKEPENGKSVKRPIGVEKEITTSQTKKGKSEAYPTASSSIPSKMATEKKGKESVDFQSSTSIPPRKKLKVEESKFGSASTPVHKEEVKTKPVTLKGGTEILDVVIGKGKTAKPGKKVFIWYTGRLAHNKKVFDSHVAGPDCSKPYMFRLGVGEVIPGWDNGIAGMKVGGKRKLTIPSKQGYREVGAPGIPPHSKLLFDVELVKIK